MAEETGIIREIGYWVMKEACTQFQRWKTELSLPDGLRLNINVSSVQLLRPGYPQEVQRILSDTGIHPGDLALEITETAFIHDQEAAAAQLQALKAMGVAIHLDDFGTGYSSLSFINQFMIDALKIERQFITGLQEDRQANLVSAVIALGEKLGLNIIAEGIETQGQMDILKDAGCRYGQGYFYSKPLSLQDTQKLFAEK